MKTLSELNLDYLDLYLIHFPISMRYVPFEKRYPPTWVYDETSGDPADNKVIQDNVSVMETWRALGALVEEGLIRYIEVSNFPAILIMEIVQTFKIMPSVLQVEMNPYLQLNQLRSFCEAQGIQITAFSPFASISYQSLGIYDGHNVFEETVVIKLSEKYHMAKAQVLLIDLTSGRCRETRRSFRKRASWRGSTRTLTCSTTTIRTAWRSGS